MKQHYKLLYVDNSVDTFYSYRLPLALAARRVGFEVHVAAPHGEREYAIAQNGFIFHPIQMTRSGMNLIRELRTISELYRLYREIQPDLVHHLRLKPVLYGGLAALFARVPAEISMPTGLGHVFISNSAKAKCLRALTLLGCRLAFLHRNVKVVLQNPDDRAVFVNARTLPKHKTVLIKGSGVDIAEFEPAPEPQGRPVVLLAGRMLREKGILEFVQAAHTLQRHSASPRFVLVGDTDAGNPTGIPASQLNGWSESGVVEWWGFREDMRSVLAEATIVCLPSYREGVPKVLLEAAAAGRAMVSTDVPGCREVVRHGQNGLLVPAGDVEALTGAIRLLLENPRLREQMARRGRHIAIAEFSMDRVICETLETYHKVLAKRTANERSNTVSDVAKRGMDLLFAGVGLACSAPLFAAAAAAIKISSPGPVLYRGARVGLNGRTFFILKFRSMVVNAEKAGGSATAADDPRVTRIGRILRKYKIDELPQLINVLQGHMSLVGPRPEVQKYVDLYNSEQKNILTLRPGITDWASIWNSNEGQVLDGSPDPEETYEELIRPTKLALQLAYWRRHSVSTDIKILFHTAVKLLIPTWVPKELKPYGRVKTYKEMSKEPAMSSPSIPVQSTPQTNANVPTDTQQLRFMVPSLPPLDSVLTAYSSSYANGLITNASCVERFEKAAAEYLGVKHCVAVSSCTSGLMLVCRALDLSGEVIVPSFTFFATAHALRWNGIRPVLADCTVDTWNIDAADVSKRLTNKTSAIVGVHMYGNPCDVETLSSLASHHGLKLIFDAAHAFGSRYRGHCVGQFGDAEVFSLSPTKVLIAGEGGLVATNDALLAKRVRVLRNYGDSGNYDPEWLGLNARMAEFNAALALSGLTRLDEKVARRNEVARLYTEKLRSLPGVRFQETHPEDVHTYKDYSIHITPGVFGASRDEIAQALLVEHIETKRYFYPPLHGQKLYQIYQDSALPTTDFVANNILSLPIYEALPDAVINSISDNIVKIQHSVAVKRQDRGKERDYATASA